MLQFLPLIGAGISAIAALFAPKPEPIVVVNENKTDLVSMRDEAVRAGFNPVSVLRSGAWSGFSRSTQTQSGGVAHNPWGDALGHIGAGLSNFSWNPLSDELTKSAIKLNNAQANSFAAPMFKTSGSSQQRMTVAKGGGFDWMKPGVETKAEGVKSLIDPDGNPFLLLPGTDAQTVEDELGEGAGNVHGLERWFKSWMWNNFGGRPTTYKGVQTKQYTGGGF